MTAAIDKDGHWHLMVAMDGRMTIGDGNGQWQGCGETMVQCRRLEATVQCTTASAAAMDNNHGQQPWRQWWTMEMALDNGSGQWVV
jgi:hypothetical protein